MTGVPAAIGRWRRACLDVLFPQACAACDALGREPFCRTCEAATDTAPSLSLPGLDAVVAVWMYGGPVAQAIHRMKYRGGVEFARPLGAVLASRVAGLKFDLAVPMPMSTERLRTRGYNQARELTRSMPMTVSIDALRRTKERSAQVGRSATARRAELKGVFRGDPGRVFGRRVLLVDDVVTTGATARAAAEALHGAGASFVGLAALAAHPASLDDE